MEDERMQAFLARRHTNMLKLSMLCSVSESDDLVLELRHWERALSFMPEVDESLALVIDAAADPTTQQGVNHIILSKVRKSPQQRILISSLVRYVNQVGIPRDISASTIQQMLEGKMLVYSGSYYEIPANTDNNLKIINNVINVDEEAGMG